MFTSISTQNFFIEKVLENKYLINKQSEIWLRIEASEFP